MRRCGLRTGVIYKTPVAYIMTESSRRKIAETVREFIGKQINEAGGILLCQER